MPWHFAAMTKNAVTKWIPPHPHRHHHLTRREASNYTRRRMIRGLILKSSRRLKFQLFITWKLADTLSGCQDVVLHQRSLSAPFLMNPLRNALTHTGPHCSRVVGTEDMWSILSEILQWKCRHLTPTSERPFAHILDHIMLLQKGLSAKRRSKWPWIGPKFGLPTSSFFLPSFSIGRETCACYWPPLGRPTWPIRTMRVSARGMSIALRIGTD